MRKYSISERAMSRYCLIRGKNKVAIKRRVSRYVEETDIPPVIRMTLPLRSGISHAGLKVGIMNLLLFPGEEKQPGILRYRNVQYKTSRRERFEKDRKNNEVVLQE